MTVLEVIEEFWRQQEYKPRMIMERNTNGEVVGHIDEKGWCPNYIEDRSEDRSNEPVQWSKIFGT